MLLRGNPLRRCFAPLPMGEDAVLLKFILPFVETITRNKKGLSPALR